MKKRIHQIELFIKYPHDVQHEVFETLIKKASKTAYGVQYGFESIHTPEDFQSKVPVVNYESLFPYVERAMKGEQNVLWPSEIHWFAKSSGTTNARSKFIPVSPEALEDCHFKGGKDMLSLYFNNYPEAKMFTGKGLVIGGSHQINQLDSNSKSFYGDVSAVLLSNLPWWAQMARTPSMDIALMDDWEKKLEKMVEQCSGENVTSMSGVPTWTLVLLEKILQRTGKKHILEVWPNLEVFFHGAVSFTPYEAPFKRLIPSASMRYMETYNASEGFFGIQDQTNSKELLLMLDYGVYYEFILLDQMDREHPVVLSLDQVEIGKVYALLISTNAGLWRYKIGDTVKFTSTNPYRVVIAGRTKHFINAFGEELMIENADAAITYASGLTYAEVANYTAAPLYLDAGKKGGHEWVIEFKKAPAEMTRFVQLLDEKLREVNSDYDAKRHKDLALIAPKVHVAPAGTFHAWLKQKGKLGGQHKVPRLANNREYLDEILILLANT